MKPKILALSGGGIRALSFVGALSFLDASGILTDIKSYYSVSAGAFIASLLVVGYTISELMELIKTFDFTRLQHIEVDTLLNFTDTLGVDTGEHFIKTISELFENKGISKTITFKELYDKTEKELYMFGTNLNKLLPVRMSYKHTPDLQVIIGLRITMSVPGWLTPIAMPDTNRLLIDGGICNNYPIIYVPIHERIHTLGITLSKESDECSTVPDIITYISQIVSCSIHTNSSKLIQKYKKQTITVSLPNFSFLKFDLSHDERKTLLNAGISAASTYCLLP